MIVDFCPQFLYFILNYSFLVCNSTGVGETQDKRIRAIVNSDRLNQTKLSYKIDSRLRNITTNIQMFAEVVVESKPCEMNLVRKTDKQAQMIQQRYCFL
jgi:hypothetical protein